MTHLFKEHDFIAVRPLTSNIIIVIPLIEDGTNGLFFIGWDSDKVYLSNLTDENLIYSNESTDNSYEILLLPNPPLSMLRVVHYDKYIHIINDFKYAVYRYLQEIKEPMQCFVTSEYPYTSQGFTEIEYTEEKLIVAYSDSDCAFLALDSENGLPNTTLFLDGNEYTKENGFSNVVPIPKENPDFYEQYPHLLEQALSYHTGYKELL